MDLNDGLAIRLVVDRAAAKANLKVAKSSVTKRFVKKAPNFVKKSPQMESY
jgi:hypothetical protein